MQTLPNLQRAQDMQPTLSDGVWNTFGDIMVEMVVKLYKLDASPSDRACMVACDLFNVPVEFVEVDVMKKEHLKPEFLKINPLHTIPVLQDGGLVIHDSSAILMYVADVYGKQDSFYPRDPAQRALVNQKLFFAATTLFPRLRNITAPILEDGSKKISQKNLDAVDEAYGFLEAFLSQTEFLAGNNITIADIAAYTTISSLLFLLELNAQKYPKTAVWIKKMEKLSYVQKHNTKGNESLKKLINEKLHP